MVGVYNVVTLERNIKHITSTVTLVLPRAVSEDEMQMFAFACFPGWRILVQSYAPHAKSNLR